MLSLKCQETKMFYRTGVSNSNKELERAINERNCDEVKVLLSTGANINHTLNENLDTMLHTAKTAGIACDLLGYSADVNARNLYEKTPLHSAVIDGRSIEIVKTLLNHGADVDAKDSKGNTPLNYAVKMRNKNLNVVRYLVMQGADIHAKNQECQGSDNHCSPLDNAVLLDDLPCIKVLITYTLLKNAGQIKLKKWYLGDSSGIDLRPYYRRPIFRVISRFQHSCNCELNRMKREKLNDKLTLFQIVVPQYVCRDSYSSEDTENFAQRSCEILTCGAFPIYHDVIFDKLKGKSEKSALVKILSSTKVYLESTEQNSDNKRKQIVLNPDSTNVLAKYLSKEDLFSLIVAFYKPSKQASNVQSINNLLEIRQNFNKRLYEASTSSSYAKFFKLM